jgi:hypothetical protein
MTANDLIQKFNGRYSAEQILDMLLTDIIIETIAEDFNPEILDELTSDVE